MQAGLVSCLFICFACLASSAAVANNLSLLVPFGQTAQSGTGKPILASLNSVQRGPDTAPDVMTQAPLSPSLFLGHAGSSLFAPHPPRERGGMQRGRAAVVQKIRYLIGKAESRKHGYDAVQFGAKKKPRKRLTQMTIGEIYKWIDDTPRQPHAIGRYQFIPKTLKRLVAQAGLKHGHQFSPKVQDLLSDLLLSEAGLERLYAGEITRKTFQHNLAKIWAGLPLPNGKSYYQGYAGNKATMSWAYFNGEMGKLFPS